MMKRLINRHPSRAMGVALAALPFVLVLVVYGIASTLRLADNPDDRLLPSLVSLVESLLRLASEPSRRTGEILLWADTWASLTRLLIGVTIGAVIGLIAGLFTGLLPILRHSLSSFFTVLAMIPPLALLPVLFITFGIGELSKVMLIVIGITPFIIRDIQQRVEELPREQLIKAQTLGGSSWQIALRVVLPQVLPRLLDAVRLSLGAAWLFLIAAEAIAATEGLGYRIFLVRRYLDMETILPYVAWITLLAWLLDILLRRLSHYLFPWYRDGRGK